MVEDQQWQASVSRYPSVSPETPEYREAEQLLDKAGYRGGTVHETKDETRAAIEGMLDKVFALDPTVGWRGIGYRSVQLGIADPERFEICRAPREEGETP